MLEPKPTPGTPEKPFLTKPPQNQTVGALQSGSGDLICGQLLINTLRNLHEVRDSLNAESFEGLEGLRVTLNEIGTERITANTCYLLRIGRRDTIWPRPKI